jgi:hypothetical protein
MCPNFLENPRCACEACRALKAVLADLRKRDRRRTFLLFAGVAFATMAGSIGTTWLLMGGAH